MTSARRKIIRSPLTARHAGGRLSVTAILSSLLLLTLGACASAPELDTLEASFDAPPDQREVRVATDIAGTGFGRTVARAVEQNPRLDASNADVLAARAREDGEAGGFLPRFSLGVTLASGLSGGSMSLSPILELVQLIYDGGATASRQIAARARVFESRGARLEVAAALALEGVEAWQNLVAAREQYDLARDNEAAHRDLLGQVEDRSDAGAGTQSDVLTAQARLADAVSRRVQALSQRDRAEAVFREIFARDAASLSAPPEAPTLSEVPDETLIASSPRVRGIDASIKAAEADLAVTEAARFPRVDLRTTGRREVRGDGIDTDLDLLLDYDSGAPGQKAAAIRESQARLAALHADRDSLAREIRRALDFARSDRRTGRERVRAAREAVAANAATVAAAREEFSIGRRGLIGLLDAQRDLFEAGERLIVARREQALSGYVVLALTGDILDAFAITLPSLDTPAADPDDTTTEETPS
jgi:outer membrane protein TolC